MQQQYPLKLWSVMTPDEQDLLSDLARLEAERDEASRAFRSVKARIGWKRKALRKLGWSDREIRDAVAEVDVVPEVRVEDLPTGLEWVATRRAQLVGEGLSENDAHRQTLSEMFDHEDEWRPVPLERLAPADASEYGYGG